MADSLYGDIAESQGFRRIGELAHRIRISIWWHSTHRIHLVLFPLGGTLLLKGSKSYYLRSISREGQTWARDVGPLHDYLEAHFPELHLSFEFFRDITPTLSGHHLQQKLAIENRELPTLADLSSLQRKLYQTQNDLESNQRLAALSDKHDLLHSYLNREAKGQREELESLRNRVQAAHECNELKRHLQKEYERKGSACCLLFSINSHLQIAQNAQEFGDVLRSVVKELEDYHRYQIHQKLCGGQLNIQVEEAEEPALIWLENWLAGGLSPRQLDRFQPQFQLLQETYRKQIMVTADEDIQLADSVREEQKLFASRVVSNLLDRLDHPLQSRPKEFPKEALPATIGCLIDGDLMSNESCILPLSQLDHLYISGSTGSGKSYLGRVILEEACSYDLSILILDPRNQAAGILIPEDREEILAKYPEFGFKSSKARGFQFNYYSPGQYLGNLRDDLRTLGRGRTIVSFKGLDDKERCNLFCRILDATFEDYAREESDRIRLLLFIEEAQRFTKKRVAEDAKSAGERAEIALDRTVREGRKYGCCVVILSQTIRDFAYNSASIRQNTNTKAFLHNSDSEIDYASDFIGDGRQLVKLTTGAAIIYNASWGTLQAKIRPPFSKVWELSKTDTEKIVSRQALPKRDISEDAWRLLELVQAKHASHQQPLNLTQSAELLGIGSKRRLQELVDELVHNGLVKTRKLPLRGQPRVLEPISSTSDETLDERRSKPGEITD